VLRQRAAPHAELLSQGTETGRVIVPNVGTGVQIAEYSLHLKEMAQTISCMQTEYSRIGMATSAYFLETKMKMHQVRTGKEFLLSLTVPYSQHKTSSAKAKQTPP
jgi:hypothetical protein